MQVSTQPILTDEDRKDLATFLESVLRSETLEVPYGSRLRCAPKLVLFYSDSFHKVVGSHSHTWSIYDNCYIGTGTDASQGDRLSILLALTQYLPQPWPVSLREAVDLAVSRYLLSQSNEFKGNLVVSATPATGLAFSDTQAASLVDGVWMLPSGEEVDVSEWTIAASGVAIGTVEAPVETQFVVGQRVRYSQIPGTGYPAGVGTISRILEGGIYTVVSDTELPGTPWDIDAAYLSALEEAPVETVPVVEATSSFTPGQRVRYTHIPGQDTRPGEAVVVRVVGNMAYINPDDQSLRRERAVFTHRLTAIEAEAPPTFHIGDRVRYSRIPHVTEGGGEGVVVDIADFDHGRINVRVDRDNEIYFIFTEDLTLVEVAPVQDDTQF